MLIMVMGLPGSGKSYFAKRLCKRINAHYIGSDQLRRESETIRRYEWEDKLSIYVSMRGRVETALKEGNAVVLDATFFKNELRAPFISLAENLKIPFFQINIIASEEVIKERISVPREDSDADYEVYKKLAKEFETPTLPYLELTSTQHNIEDMLNEALQYLPLI